MVVKTTAHAERQEQCCVSLVMTKVCMHLMYIAQCLNVNIDITTTKIQMQKYYSNLLTYSKKTKSFVDGM